MPPRILVVHADRPFVRSVAGVFVAAGFEVRVAFDCEAASADAAAVPPHLVVADFHLAGSGGPGLVDHLRERREDVPMAALYVVDQSKVSSSISDSYLGLEDFILKPTHPAALLERARILLRRMAELPRVVTHLGRFVSRASATGPVRVAMTVMFTDVRSFTSMSEVRDPETVAAALNVLFGDLAAAVLRYGGRIDKFMGDGMMALFYSEELTLGHELAAVHAACEIVRTAGDAEVGSLLTGVDLHLGIGINTGTVVLGPIGPPFAREVTAIGDTVNTAARLCGEAAAGEVVVSESTFAAVRDQVEVVNLREVFLKGKRASQTVYAVQLRPAELLSEAE